MTQTSVCALSNWALFKEPQTEVCATEGVSRWNHFANVSVVCVTGVELLQLLRVFGITNNLMEETTRTIIMIRTFVLLLLIVPSAMAQATFHGDVARTGVYESPGPVATKRHTVDLQN